MMSEEQFPAYTMAKGAMAAIPSGQPLEPHEMRAAAAVGQAYALIALVEAVHGLAQAIGGAQSGWDRS